MSDFPPSFSSLAHYETQTANWAKKVLTTLPREIRDMIYAHLWRRTYTAASPQRAEDSEAKWFIPCIVGAQFANEASHWYYLHGCMGAEINVRRLDDWLHDTSRYVGVKRIDCKIRAFKVLVDKNTTDTVLDTLFNITRIRGFELGIRVLFVFGNRMDVSWLVERGQHLARVMGRFREGGDKAGMEIKLRQTRKDQFGRGRAPAFSYHLKSQDAEDMLTAGYEEWEKWLWRRKDQSKFHLMKNGMRYG